MDNKSIGLKIRELRSKMGMTTVTLGKKLRISQAQVSRLENGMQGFRSATLTRIAKVLGVPPMYFFVEDDGAATVEVERELQKRGLKTSRGLRKALANPAFLRFMERCAKGFTKDKKNLDKMAVAINRVA